MSNYFLRGRFRGSVSCHGGGRWLPSAHLERQHGRAAAVGPNRRRGGLRSDALPSRHCFARLLARRHASPTLKLRSRGCGRRYLTPVAAQQACRSRRAHSRAAPTPRPPSLSSVPRRASMSALTRACRCFSRRRPPRCTAPGLCAVYAECWNGPVGDCGPVWLRRRRGHLPAHRRDHHFCLAPWRRRVHALARWRLCAARGGADRAV